MGVLNTSGDPAAVVASYMASFDGRDADAIAAHVSENFESVHTAALGHGFSGADEYRRRLPSFLTDMASVHYDVQRTVVEGSTVVVAYETTARWKGDHPVTVPGTMWFDVVDGEITRRVDYWDSKVFTDQIPDEN